jgi:BirA family biotin operon repressor/biotin-[acetyl-CoA-carboxylase] ligase
VATTDLFLDAGQLRRCTFVRHVELHDMLASTNDRAIELAKDTNLEIPALVVACLQTAGRGRGQNTWWSDEGALTFSLLIDAAATGIGPASWPRLSLATAVAVADALASELNTAGNRSLVSHLAIKWPNDVLLGGDKVCGILIESPGGGAPAKDRLIIGIGINVNNSCHRAPREAARGGTALCDITGKRHELHAMLVTLMGAIAERISQLKRQDNQLVQAWQRLNFLAGQHIVVQQDGRSMEGECLQIADDGAILINTRLGPRRLYSGSVRVVP